MEHLSEREELGKMSKSRQFCAHCLRTVTDYRTVGFYFGDEARQRALTGAGVLPDRRFHFCDRPDCEKARVATLEAGGVVEAVWTPDPCPRCGGDHDRIDRRDPCPVADPVGYPGQSYDQPDVHPHDLTSGAQ